MTYLMADAHGCYQEFLQLLETIGFSADDELFLLGDVVDRGPEPISLLRHIIQDPRCSLLLGNHEAFMLAVLRSPLAAEITEESIATLTPEVLRTFSAWMEDGGQVTLRQFRQLDRDAQADILSYLEDAPYYETIEHRATDALYVLTHAGLARFDPHKELEEYDPQDFLWERADYSREYFPGGRIVLVTGHTPTPLIRADRQPLIYREHGHLALDCGAVYGGRLAAYCVETGEEFYVNGPDHRSSFF